MLHDSIQFNSACFLLTLQDVAAKQGKTELGARAVVHADVSLGLASDRPGFGFKVVLRVEGVEDQEILDAAHEVSYTVYTINRADAPCKLVNIRRVHIAALCVKAS